MLTPNPVSSKNAFCNLLGIASSPQLCQQVHNLLVVIWSNWSTICTSTTLVVCDDSSKTKYKTLWQLTLTLQIYLDYTVRSNQSVFFRLPDGAKLDIFSLNRFATEKPRRRPVKRPHLDGELSGILLKVVTYLGALLSGSDNMTQIRNAAFQTRFWAE